MTKYFWVKYNGEWYIAEEWLGGYHFDIYAVSDSSCLDEIGPEIIRPKELVDD